MTQFQQEILLRCFELQQRISEQNPDHLSWWAREVWEEEVAHGPSYRCSIWFGKQSPARTKKYQRAIVKLEKLGLLIRWGRYGELTTNLRLSEQGESVAESLIAAITPEAGYPGTCQA